jgi:hypothetical protein
MLIDSESTIQTPRGLFATVLLPMCSSCPAAVQEGFSMKKDQKKKGPNSPVLSEATQNRARAFAHHPIEISECHFTLHSRRIVPHIIQATITHGGGHISDW